MTKDAILSLCNHIRQRQKDFGPEEGFRFKAYFDGKEMVKAVYGSGAGEEKAAARSKKRKVERKGQKKAKRNANEKESTLITNPETSTTNPTYTPYEPQIDPALLGDQGLSNINHAATVQVIPAPSDIGGQVGDSDMQILIANGFPNALPINGPNEGPPKYIVSAAALRFLSNLTGDTSTIPPGLSEILVPVTETVAESSKTIPTKKGKVEVPKTRQSGRVRTSRTNQKAKADALPDGNPPFTRTRSHDKRGKRSGKR